MPNNSGDKLTQAATMIVGLCAAALNFSALTELAQAAGYLPWLAWCYPVIVDAYGLTALRAWLRATHGDRVQRWAKVSSVFALLLSMASAGLHVFADRGHLPTAVAFAVSTLPALMLGLAVHLLVLVRAEVAMPTPTAQPVTATITTAPAAGGVDELPQLTPGGVGGNAAGISSNVVAAPDEPIHAPVSPPVQLQPARPAPRRRGPTKRTAARAFYDAYIGVDDARGSTELGAQLASEFDVHEATARQWVVAFRREDAAAGTTGLEAAS